MIRILYTVCLLSIAVLASGQSFFNETLDFNVTIEGINQIKTIHDGYLIAGGSLDPLGGNDAAVFAKIDPSGDTVFSTRVIINGFSFIDGRIAVKGNGNYVASWSASKAGTTDIEYFIAAINKFGDTSWTKFYGLGNQDDVAKSMQELSDGNILIGGFTQHPTSELYSAYILKIDTLGNEIWHRTFGDTGFANTCEALIELSDRSILIAGTRQFSPDSDIMLIKIDSLGNEIWRKYWGGDEYDSFYSLSEMSDGYILAAGVTEDISLTGYLVKLDTAGNILWEKEIGSDVSDVFEAAYEVNGSIYAGGVSRNYSDFDDINGWLVKLTLDGDTIWTRSYTPSNNLSNDIDDYVWDMAPANDGGFVFCGFSRDGDSGTQDAWYFKVDSNGCVTEDCANYNAIEELPLSAEISIYPNPTQGKVTITLPAEALATLGVLPTEFEFYLTDLSGRISKIEVVRQSISGAEIEFLLDMENEVSGSYLLFGRQNGKTLFAGRIGLF